MTAPRTRARGLVLALALLCLGAGFVLGRLTAGAGAARPPGYLEQLAGRLDLRPDQVAAVHRVLTEEDREIDALLQRGLDGISGEVAARRARTEEQVLALLDEAQRARYREAVALEARR